MELTFPPIINQATVPITTANCNTLFTLTSFSTITATAISSPLCTVSINPLQLNLFAAVVDTSFETRLNTMKNGIFRLWVTSEKFISINNISGKSREEID